MICEHCEFFKYRIWQKIGLPELTEKFLFCLKKKIEIEDPNTEITCEYYENRTTKRWYEKED